jgi:hypothetical protein
MLLRWGLIYLQFVLVVVLGCLLYFQHLRTAAGIADVDSLNAKLTEQHKLLTDAEKKVDVASREARSAADKLAEERLAREQAEKAHAQAQNEIAELKKGKDAADETARQALAHLEGERQARKRQATIASRRSIARALRAAGVALERSAPAASRVEAEVLAPPRADGVLSPPSAAPAQLPPAAKKPPPAFNPLAPAPAPPPTSTGTITKKAPATTAPKAAKKPAPGFWDGLF